MQGAVGRFAERKSERRRPRTQGFKPRRTRRPIRWVLAQTCWMSKDTHICWKQLVETAGRKLLRIFLTFARTQMLLVNAVIVMPKLVHENVQEHECTRLRLSETARDAILLPIIRDA